MRYCFAIAVGVMKWSVLQKIVGRRLLITPMSATSVQALNLISFPSHPSIRGVSGTMQQSTITTTTRLLSTSVVNGEQLDSKPFVPWKFKPKPFDYHHELTIRIDSLTNMGWGIGRVSLVDEIVPDEDGDEDSRLWVVMVPNVIVGELVRVRIYRNFPNYSEADLIEVVEASPHRVKPECALAGRCGGCQYQHMSIEAQREWKTKHVEELLQQQVIEGYKSVETLKVLPTLGTDEIFHYRSKLTPHYSAPKKNGLEYELRAIGFKQTSITIMIDVPECPIATIAVNEKYKIVRNELREKATQGLLNQEKKKKKRGVGVMGATLLFRQADDDPETGVPVVVTDHNEYMTTTVKDLKFRHLAGNFFQNNNFVLPLMVDAVVEAATKPTASGEAPSHLIDCYCGSGLFALSTASHFQLCVGIELNKRAVDEATANAKTNGISNCHFVAASAEGIFKSPPKLLVDGHEEHVKDFPRHKTVVVLDPPRKGCSDEFLRQLYEYSPQRIIYMSCGPDTQARDAKGIVEVGGYDIVSTQPIDLFPQTKHIECLMVFEKKPSTKL